MNKETVRAFVETHKTELAIGAGIASGIVLLVLTKKLGISPKDAVTSTTKIMQRDIDIPADFTYGKILSLWREGGYINAIVDGITVGDLGKLGAEFVSHGLVADGSEASIVIGFLDKA